MTFFFKNKYKTLFIIILLLISFNGISQKNSGLMSADKTIINPDSLKPDSVIKINYEQMIDSIISYAEKYLGTRYRAGGYSKNGFDCSGFTSYVFARYGINLPRGARDQALKGMPLDKKDIKRGDLVFFKGRNSKSPLVGHVGLVVEKNDSIIRFIHASSRKGITFDFTSSDYYKIRFIGAKRLLGENVIDSLWADFKFPALDVEDTLNLNINADSIAKIESNKENHQSQDLSSNTHIVKKGETLYAIAKKYNTTADKIKTLNNLKNDNIRPGQILTLSKITKSVVDTKKTNLLIKDSLNIDKADSIAKKEKKKEQLSSQNKTSKTYTVRKGDTLYGIAKKNNTTADKIKKLNKLDNDKIQPGQKLVLK